MDCPAISLPEPLPVCEPLSVPENDRTSIVSTVDSDSLSDHVVNEGLEFISGELSASFADDTSHFVGSPVSVVGSDAPNSVTEEIVEKSNTPCGVAKNKGAVAIDKGCEAPASVVMVEDIDKPDEVVNIVKQSNKDTASVVCEVSSQFEGGDTPENNVEMQSSRNSSVVSSDTLTGMFDMASKRADDNAQGTKNSENNGLHADVN